MDHKLTLCLFILDRHNFTLRFLRYYNTLNIPYKLIIGDGSKANLNYQILSQIKKNKNIQYFKFKNEFNQKLKEYDHNKFYLRILHCLNKVKTKYVKFISDDDMIIEYSTKKCIKFLEKNNHYDAVGGSGIDFTLSKKYYGNIKNIRSFYKIKNFKSLNITKKIKQFFDSMFDCWHIVFRTKKILKIFKISSRYNNDDKDFKDHFHEMITHIFLKIYFFKDPLILHESHNDPHDGALRGNVVDRLKDKNFLKKLDKFSENTNKIYPFKDKNFIRSEYYRGVVLKFLETLNIQSYYSFRDLTNMVKKNLNTKIKKNNNLNIFLSKSGNKKLNKELILIQRFLFKFDK